MLLMGIKTGKYQKALRHIDQKSKEIGYNLLPEIFAAYSNEKRPIWAQGAEILVNEIYNKMPNRLSQAIA